jgi:hypothetical protein
VSQVGLGGLKVIADARQEFYGFFERKCYAVRGGKWTDLSRVQLGKCVCSAEKFMKPMSGTNHDTEYILPNDEAEQERLGMYSSLP